MFGLFTSPIPAISRQRMFFFSDEDTMRCALGCASPFGQLSDVKLDVEAVAACEDPEALTAGSDGIWTFTS